jgi:hypothetical protein
MQFAHLRRRDVISLFGGMVAAWSLAAHAQESATMRVTEPRTVTLPQIEMARLKDFSLFSAQGIGGAWLRPSTPFDERYGQW